MGKTLHCVYILDSPLKQKVDLAILNLNSGGILNMLKDKWLKNYNLKCSEQASSSRLEMEQIGGIFVLLIMGLFIGLIALILESGYKNMCTKRKNHRN